MKPASNERFWLIIMGLFYLGGRLPSAAAWEVKVSLRPEQTGVQVPVRVELSPQQAAAVPGGWQLVDLAAPEAPPLPAQVSTPGEAKPRWLSFLLYSEPATGPATHRFRLVHSDAPAPPVFQFRDLGAGRLELSENGQPVLVYNYGMQLAGGVPERYRRADYLHPLYDLDGTVLTDDFPRDHLHHRGLSWTWPQVKVGEKTYDLWALQGIGQRFEKWLVREVGPVYALLGVQSGWYVGEERVVEETVRLRVFRAGPVGRAIDVELTLEAADRLVLLRGRPPHKGYGGLTLRFAPRKDPVVHTSEGRLKGDAVQKRFLWSDYSARFGAGKRISGAAIFDHPENPNHPPGWLNRYYGILNPTWPGLEWATLEPGRPVHLFYRVWIHRGGVEAGRVAAAFAAFVHPPQVQVQPPRKGLILP
ncbi:MAG TPA: hypothetical protein EYP85_14890 [Armatimonadetes bacterium]|nr:hypothetical protein [Armatimonadota bacterium]